MNQIKLPCCFNHGLTIQTITQRWTRLVLMALLTISVGCSAMKPQEFYQLTDAGNELGEQQGQDMLLLGPIKLADYLQREQLVQRQTDEQLAISTTARWAGSLQEEIGQLLLLQLMQETGNSNIALYPDRLGVRQQQQLIININRLDSGAEQPAVLEVQWRLLDAKGTMRDTRVIRLQAEHSGSVASQVKAQSVLLQQLARKLAVVVNAP